MVLYRESGGSQIICQSRKTGDFQTFYLRPFRFHAEEGVTNVARLRNATTTGRSCLGGPPQVLVGLREIPRLSNRHSGGVTDAGKLG